MSLLKSSDALKVVDTFTRSERIWHDLQLAIAAQGSGADDTSETQDPHTAWEESLVVRSWVE